MNTGDSLDHFRTVAFAQEYMHELIRYEPNRFGEIDARRWWGLVPECYEAGVYQIMKEVFTEFYGQKMTREVVYAFVDALHFAIVKKLEPIMPDQVAPI